ncbi:hypothetical protein OIU76_023825 [Salix suchowensis]|nr:hypothetical protein OIU76_023825 [Salix suchowensis]
MAEKHSPSSLGIICRKSMLCFFLFASSLFMLSWYFVLHSTSSSGFIDLSLLPHPKFTSVIGNGNSSSWNRKDVEPSIGNRAILVDNEEQEENPQKKDDLGGVKCSSFDNNSRQPLKIFITKVPEYPGGLNLQHSIEYWLTLDLLASEVPGIPKAGSAVRVRNSSEADVIYVPFFSSLSYNRYSKVNPQQNKSKDKLLQEKLLKFLTSQKEWKRYGGRDHVILAHHPNSMLDSRVKLWPAIFILADFGRYPPNIANVGKDVISPYKHVIRSYVNDSSDFDSRPTLLYFQGAIYRKDGGFARQELFYLLKDEKDVHFQFGSDTPSSNRLFDAIASHCVPVIISDDIELPYEDVLDYSQFCIFVRTSDAVREKFLLNLIRSIKKDEWTRMWQRLKEVENLFEFQYPSREGDAVQMIWQAVARKVPAMRLKLNKLRRFSRFGTQKDGELRKIPSPGNFW